jgi:enoyl-CoA hydratase/carnithine racemase
MSELVTVNTENHVADVRLNRPEKYNALSPDMFAAISGTGEAVMKDGKIRAVVLSGNGRGFCAGLDFESEKLKIHRPTPPSMLPIYGVRFRFR